LASRPTEEEQEMRADLEARAREITARLRAIDEEAGDEPLAGEIRTEWESLTAEHDTIREKNARLEQIRAGANNPSAQEAAQFGQPGLATRTTDGGSVQDQALRSIEANESELSPEAGDRIERLVRRDKYGLDAGYIAAVAAPAYEQAFSRMLSGSPVASFEMSPEEVEAVRAVRRAQELRSLSIGGGSPVGSEGGFAVPFALDPTIIATSDGSVNPLRSIARVQTILSNEWRGVSSDGITLDYEGEADEADDDSPTLAQPTVTANRVSAFIPFTFEVDQDWNSMRSEMAKLISDGKDDLESAAFTSGTGIGQPEGIVAALAGGASIVSTAAVGTFAAADIYALLEALPPRFRPRAAFLANLSILNVIAQEETTNGARLFPSIDDGQLLRKRAYEASAMDGTTTPGDQILLAGDFRHYLIVDRIGMSVEVIPHLFGAAGRPTGQRGIYAFWRNGAAVLASEAFRLLEVDAT
jgi:HK97 family phage major capsid protein